MLCSAVQACFPSFPSYFSFLWDMCEKNTIPLLPLSVWDHRTHWTLLLGVLEFIAVGKGTPRRPLLASFPWWKRKKFDFHFLLLISLMVTSEVRLSACTHCLYKCFYSENSSCLAAWVHAAKPKLIFLLALCEIPWLEHLLSLYFCLSHLRCMTDVKERTPCS